MDRLSRFRRNKDKDKDKNKTTSPAPSSSTPKTGAPPSKLVAEKSRTPSPAPAPAPHQNLAPPIPPRSHRKEKRSPFHGLHLRATGVGKRARESPPASLPQSPTAASVHGEQKLLASPIIWGKQDEKLSVRGGDGPEDGAPRIPHFLTLSEHEIEGKFQDLIWLERDRLAQSHNPRWARVSSAFKNLDRYVNIQPWENNRVHLGVSPGGFDYINASPVTLLPIEAAPGAKPVAPTPPNTQQHGATARAPTGGKKNKELLSGICNYIAMQGPKQVSADHVWRMVVEQLHSPAVIVMLTETHEGHLEKCYPYFPRVVGETVEVNQGDEFGDGFRATVTCEAIEETEAGDAIELRRMVVRVQDKEASEGRTGLDLNNGVGDVARADAVKEPGEDVIMKSPVAKPSRGKDIDTTMASPSPLSHQLAKDDSDYEQTVYHYLYKKWPDFGVPALEDIESFFTLMRLSRERNTNPANPRIVHCSAGVGRSGTFIALEHLVRALDSGVLAHWDSEESIAAQKQQKGHREDDHDGEEGSSIEGAGNDLIYDTVDLLREQRRTMVQAESQYLFLYQVLRKLWQDKYGGGDEEPARKRIEVDPFVDNSAGKS